MWKRVLVLLGVLILIVAAGAALLVHLYLKPERIRPLVVRRLEGLCGRRVTLARVEVGLFRGIHLRDLRIKENDGRTDFLRLEALSVRPALGPLLKGEVVLQRVVIRGLYVRVVRRKDGSFNWEDLRFLRKPSAEGKSPSSVKRTGGGPPSLIPVVPDLEILKSRLEFLDETGALPHLEAPFDFRASISPDLLRAKLSLKEVLYRRLTLSGVEATARLAGGRLVFDLSGQLAGGKILSHVEGDLSGEVPNWRIRQTVRDLEVGEVLAGLYPDLPGRVRGRLSYEGNFTARGLTGKGLLRTLSGGGAFELKPLELTEIPATKKLARILGLEELRTLLFDSAAGTFRVARERVTLRAVLSGRALSARLARGTVSFSGELDLPLDLTLSPTLSKKLTARWPPAVHLENERGEVELTVHLRGPYRRPRVILSSRPMEKELREKLREILPPSLRGLLPGR